MVLILLLLLILISQYKNYELFNNFKSDYPCRVFLSDNDFLKHMIPHHQMAIDISIQHIQNTKTGIILKILRELIWTQQYEIILMLAELNQDSEKMIQMFQVVYMLAEQNREFGLANFYADRQDAHAKHCWMLRSTLK